MHPAGPEPADSPSRSTGALLRDLALAPDAPLALLLGWGLLAFVASQLPQAGAPLAVTDGLARADLQILHGLGLDRIARSVPFWLLAALSALVGVARLLYPRDSALWHGVVALTSAETEARLRAGLSAAGLRGRLHRSERAGTVSLRAGLPWLGTAAWLFAGVCAAGWFASAARQPPPILLDVPVAGDAPVEAWQNDAGRLAPAAGRWRGQCRRAGREAIHCRLEVPGGQVEATLQAGQGQVVDGQQWTWLATAHRADTARFELRWAPTARPSDRPYALALQAGQPREAPALAVRLHPYATAAAGPLILGVAAGPQPDVFALAGPALLSGGRPAAVVSGEAVVRLQVLPAPSGWLLALATALALVGFVAGWLAPHLRVDLRGSTLVSVEVRACNRAAWLRACTDLASRPEAP